VRKAGRREEGKKGKRPFAFSSLQLSPPTAVPVNPPPLHAVGVESARYAVVEMKPSFYVCSLCLVISGCFQTHRDATRDRVVRESGVVGRQFETVKDVPVVVVSRENYERDIAPEMEGHSIPGREPSVFAPSGDPLGMLAAGTRIRISRVTFHRWPPSHEDYFLYGEVLTGAHRGMEVRVDKLFWLSPRDPEAPFPRTPWAPVLRAVDR
jgi:hypothetical protein